MYSVIQTFSSTLFFLLYHMVLIIIKLKIGNLNKVCHCFVCRLSKASNLLHISAHVPSKDMWCHQLNAQWANLVVIHKDKRFFSDTLNKRSFGRGTFHAFLRPIAWRLIRLTELTWETAEERPVATHVSNRLQWQLADWHRWSWQRSKRNKSERTKAKRE